jgi:hypothetical protein
MAKLEKEYPSPHPLKDIEWIPVRHWSPVSSSSASNSPQSRSHGIVLLSPRDQSGSASSCSCASTHWVLNPWYKSLKWKPDLAWKPSSFAF